MFGAGLRLKIFIQATPAALKNICEKIAAPDPVRRVREAQRSYNRTALHYKRRAALSAIRANSETRSNAWCFFLSGIRRQAKTILQSKLNGHLETSVTMVIFWFDKARGNEAPFTPGHKFRFVDRVGLRTTGMTSTTTTN